MQSASILATNYSDYICHSSASQILYTLYDLWVRAQQWWYIAGGCKIPVLDKEKALATLVLLKKMKPKKWKGSCWSKEWLKKGEE